MREQLKKSAASVGMREQLEMSGRVSAALPW